MKHYQLKIRNIIGETADAISVEFENPPNEKLSYKAGQFLTLVVQLNGESLRRAYSLFTSPLTGELPAVTIKRTEKGLVSNFLNDTLKAGDSIEVLEAMGQFTTDFDAANQRHIVLFGGGSGITPLMSLLKSTLIAEAQSKVSLIYCNRDINSIIFKNKLENLQIQFAEKLQIIHILENAPDTNWVEPTGFLHTELIAKLLYRLPQFDIRDTEYFMCGPGPMMDVVQKAFEELQIPKEKLHKENFGLSPEEAALKKQAEVKPDKNTIVARQVKVIYDGEEHIFDVLPDKSILETALSLDIDLPYSCQSGMCTACMGKCISGKVKLDEEDALTPKELEQGYVLTCVGHPLTDDVVIEID